MTMQEWEETAPDTQRCPGTTAETDEDAAMRVLEGILEEVSS